MQQHLRLVAKTPPQRRILPARQGLPPPAAAEAAGEQSRGGAQLQVAVTGARLVLANLGQKRRECRGYLLHFGCSQAAFASLANVERKPPLLDTQACRVGAKPVCLARILAFAQQPQRGKGRFTRFHAEGAAEPVFQRQRGPPSLPAAPEQPGQGRQVEIEGGIAQRLARPEQAGKDQVELHGGMLT